jgi:hypothetical protein
MGWPAKATASGGVWPDVEEGPFLDRLDVHVGGEVELDLARRGGTECADLRDGRFVVSSEFEMGEAHRVASCLPRPTEGGGSRLCAAGEDGEAQSVE